MRISFNPTVLREILTPLGQIIVFILGSGLILSTVMLLLALALAGSPVNQLTFSRYGVDLFAYTLSNLPQVLLDGVTIGFVYAAIALGYTMVYGVLEFINFAHSEIFMVGGVVGGEVLAYFEHTGALATMNQFVIIALAILL